MDSSIEVNNHLPQGSGSGRLRQDFEVIKRLSFCSVSDLRYKHRVEAL